jgi:hypothetical protein
MLRELNYTNRQRIRREDIELQVIQDSHANLSFKAQLKLHEYAFETLSPVPQVFVEAYRGATATWKRFAFGPANSIRAPDDLSLNEFKVPQGILFRVRVTAVESGLLPGKLLAEADAIQPRSSNEDQGFVQPLIQHMAADDIGDELWRVHYSNDLPILKINDRVQIGVDQLLLNPSYRAIYASAVMRQVLQRILLIDRFVGDEDDETDWRQRWLRFASSLTVSAVPEFEGEESIETIDDWINEAVEAFCRSSRLLPSFNAGGIS